MNVQSPDILILDFAVLVDLSTNTPTIKFSNQSSGPNLAGCKWIFNAYTPNNTPIHNSTFGAPDQTGNWTTFQLPENIPQPGGNVVWSGTSYRFRAEVQDSAGNTFILDKNKDICRPNGNVNGNNYGEGIIDIEARCSEAKLYVEDRTNYAYRKLILPNLIIQKKLTIAYPATEQGEFPDPFVVTDFTNALIPISYSGEGYQALLESIVQYDLEDSVTVQMKYKFKDSFPVQCNIDLCKLQCEYGDMVKAAQESCDRDLIEKLLIINAKMNQALVGKMQPLCKIDVGKLVEEIIALGNFSCNCDCGNGIVAMINPTSGNSGIADCNAVLACLNTLLNTLDPKCLTTTEIWGASGAGPKLQILINAIASLKCTPCIAPDQLSVEDNPFRLVWHTPANSTGWLVQYTLGDTIHTWTTTQPVYNGNGFWSVDLSTLALDSDATVIFSVKALCSDGGYSTAATVDYTTRCAAPSDITYTSMGSLLAWVTHNNSTVWRIERMLVNDPTAPLDPPGAWEIYVPAAFPVYTGSDHWQAALTPSDFIAGATYRFRISSLCLDKGFGGATVSDDFIVRAFDVCTPIATGTVSDITANSAIFTWNTAVNPEYYRIKLFKVGTPDVLVMQLDFGVFAVAPTAWNLNALEASQLYRIELYKDCGGGNLSTALIRTFTTTA